VEEAVIFRLLYHPLVARDIENIPANISNRIKKAIEQRLMVDPVKAGRPLRKSLAGHRKMRVGDYRVIYRVERNTIIVLKIGHRREVYERAEARIDS